MLLRLFGGARLETEDEEPVRGRAAHRRRLAILALLATAPAKGMARERIIGYLWPDLDAEKGRRSLSEALYLIRKELGDDAIQAIGDVLQLNANLVASDVAAFGAAIGSGRLEEAVELYTAPFLDAWYVEEAPDFERWASETRDDLAGRYRDALSALATRAEGERAWTQAAAWLGKLARIDPYSPRVALRWSKALDASGERAAAIRVLAAHESALRRDLELPVSDDVAQLAAELKAGALPAPPILPERHESTARPFLLPDVAAPQLPSAAAPALGGSRHRNRLTNRGTLLLLGAVVAAAAVFGRWLLQRSDADPVTTPRYDPHHIAVLYFDDHTAGKELGHIADGLTEELIHQLAQVPTLRVVSRNGVKRFRDAPVTPDSLAALLRAGTLVEGSVQRARDSLRVTIQLIDGNTGLHLESQVFERPMMELFAIEQDMATSVAVTLRRHLGGTVQLQSLGRGTRNSQAIDLVLRARSLRDDAARVAMHPHLNDVRSARTMLARADSLLRLAERADANWLRPTLERGWAQLQLARLTDEGAARAHAAAEQIGDAVVRRSRGNAEAYNLRGTARWRSISTRMQVSADSSRGQLAEVDLRKALALDSTLATAWATLSDLLGVRGAFAEAETAAERAVAQDAWLEGADETYFWGFGVNVMMTRYAKAQQWCMRGQRTFPESWRFYECELTLLRHNTNVPADPKRAWQLVTIMDSLDPPLSARRTGHAYSPIFRRAVAAAVSARAGDTTRARSEIQRLRSSVSGDSVLSLDLHFEEAYVWFYLGDREKTRVLLERLFAARPMLRQQFARLPIVAWVAATSEGRSKP